MRKAKITSVFTGQIIAEFEYDSYNTYANQGYIIFFNTKAVIYSVPIQNVVIEFINAKSIV